MAPGGATRANQRRALSGGQAPRLAKLRPRHIFSFRHRPSVYGSARCERQGMKSRSCGLVQRIGTADSATPHPDPSGGQAPRLAKSSTALHFLIPPSTIGLRFGTFRRWRAGIEVDWRAHPGSESGTCFHGNDEWGRERWIGRPVMVCRVPALGAPQQRRWASLACRSEHTKQAAVVP